MTPLSVWNARAAGVDPGEINSSLDEFSKYPVPEHVHVGIRDWASRYGRLQIERADGGLLLRADDRVLAEEIAHTKPLLRFLGNRVSATEFRIDAILRGELKQALVKVGLGQRATPECGGGGAIALRWAAVARGAAVRRARSGAGGMAERGCAGRRGGSRRRCPGR